MINNFLTIIILCIIVKFAVVALFFVYFLQIFSICLRIIDMILHYGLKEPLGLFFHYFRKYVHNFRNDLGPAFRRF